MSADVEKLTVGMAPDMADALRRWALDERTTVGALLEALALTALEDGGLRARVVPEALAITTARRSRR